MTGAVTTTPGRDPALRVTQSVADLRRGVPLDPAVGRDVIRDYLSGEIADYQVSAWLATLAAMGMDRDAVVGLTRAYLADAPPLDLSALDGPVVDKHSTGGVGDKTTLVVSPVVEACGTTVVKMSGRGLGFAGGTIDKLESLPGMRIDLDPVEMVEIAGRVGMVVTGQTRDLAPGDAATYRLRDVTGTVESVPLIAASIMSKKLAVGADALVLDVKVGEGALVPEPDDARRLAELMIGIGQETGIRTRAVLADMSQPLGRAVGNLIEVQEAIAVLQGEDVPGLTHLCRDLACEMLRAANPSLDAPAASVLVSDAISSGRALETFRAWVVAQGGSPDVVDDPRSVPSARRHAVVSSADGWVGSVSARSIGTVALSVGAGRRRTEDTLDHLAGVVVHRRVGDPVARGELLAELVTDLSAPERHLAELAAAFGVVSSPPSEMPWHHELVVGADEASAPPSTGTQEEER